MKLCLALNLAQVIIGFEALPEEKEEELLGGDGAASKVKRKKPLPSCSEAEEKVLRRLWKQSCEMTGSCLLYTSPSPRD